jgi:hypothetical protein
MSIRETTFPTARKLLKLAEKDYALARSEMRSLSDEKQVAAICEAPIGMRGALLELAEAPEVLIPLFPEAELCFTCKQVGVSDASWILDYATTDQILACIDLDAWSGLSPAMGKLDGWIAALAEAGEASLLRASQAMDPEMIALYLRHHADVELKPAGDEDWQPPEGGQTFEGQFYLIARQPNDDLAPLLRLLHVLFQKDYWLYFRMMHSVREEAEAEITDWALRWRTNRLEDLGFPSWDRPRRRRTDTFLLLLPVPRQPNCGCRPPRSGRQRNPTRYDGEGGIDHKPRTGIHRAGEPNNDRRCPPANGPKPTLSGRCQPGTRGRASLFLRSR